MNSIAFQQTGAGACSPAAAVKIERKHVCRLDGSRGSKTRTNGLAAARKSGEVMKTDGPGNDHMRKILKRAIDLYRRAAFGRS